MATLTPDPQAAKAHLEQVLPRQPANFRALMLYADACTKLDLGGAAMAAYEKVIESEPFFERDRGIHALAIETP